MAVKNKKISNLNIGALNCHGIVDKLDYPNVIDLISQSDIFGVSETWADKKDDIKVPGFKFFPLHREGGKGPKRGGIGLFVRESLRKNVKIRYDISSENVLWCKLDKRYFGYGEDVYVGNVYFPPEYSSREKRIKLDHFKQLIETTTKINSKNVVLIGDFNARTQKIKDTLNKDKHEDDTIHDFYSNISSIRNNQDKTTNNYGKKLIEYCISTRSYIANGRTLGDLQGKFTCHQSTGSSTVDYAVINEELKKHVKSFRVLDPNTGSDHCPIRLELACPHGFVVPGEGGDITTGPPPFRWDDMTRSFFTQRIESDSITQEIENLNKALDSCDDVDAHVKALSKIYKGSLEGKRKNNKHRNRKRVKPKAWYDKTCHEVGKRLKLVAKSLVNTPNNPYLRGSFVKTRKDYKRLLKKKKIEWRDSMIRKIESLEEKDPKEYWKLVNELRGKKQSGSNISNAETFAKFFENLYKKHDPGGHVEKEEFVLNRLGDFDLQKELDFT